MGKKKKKKKTMLMILCLFSNRKQKVLAKLGKFILEIELDGV